MQHKPARIAAKLSILLLAQALYAGSAVAAVGDNVRLYGALVTEPCVIPDGESELALTFDDITTPTLYKNGRTVGQPFSIKLAQCDLNLAKTVKVSFIGTENKVLPGLLAISNGSEASGIAIGLETAQSVPLLFNKISNAFALQSGASTIDLKAFVRGEPDALEKRSIKSGGFSAIATFSLNYD